MPASFRKERTPIAERKGIKLSQKARDSYAQAKAAEGPHTEFPLPPIENFENAMRRDEFFRPVKVATSVRIDADVLDWLKAKGEGHLTRINSILRQAMKAEQ